MSETCLPCRSRGGFDPVGVESPFRTAECEARHRLAAVPRHRCERNADGFALPERWNVATGENVRWKAPSRVCLTRVQSSGATWCA